LHDLEALHGALTSTFFPNSDLGPIEVLLFADPDAVRQETKDADGNAILPAIEKGAHPLVLSARTNARGSKNVGNYTTSHEAQAAVFLVRRFLKVNMPKAPIWFRTGLEDYAETVEVHGDYARFGHRLARTTGELGAGRAIPLGQLIAAPASEFSSGQWKRSHHASAWGFMHYLLGANSGAFRPRFDTIARTLISSEGNGAEASRAAIDKAFPDTPFTVLEAQVHDYCTNKLGTKPTFEAFTVELKKRDDVPFIVAPADPARVQALLVDLKRKKTLTQRGRRTGRSIRTAA
jgi:hypothetical protein